MPRVTGRESNWPRRHVGPLLGMLVIVVTGMTYSFLWNRLFYHSTNWDTPDDIWNTFRAAQYVTWGGKVRFTTIRQRSRLFPESPFILAPVAKVAGHLHLSSWLLRPSRNPRRGGFSDRSNWHSVPTLLFPLDIGSPTFQCGVTATNVLLVVRDALIWPSVALWGHPEDALSLALGIYGLIAARRVTGFASELFFGLAMSIQPLVLLLVPVVVALVPVRRWPVRRSRNGSAVGISLLATSQPGVGTHDTDLVEAAKFRYCQPSDTLGISRARAQSSARSDGPDTQARETGQWPSPGLEVLVKVHSARRGCRTRSHPGGCHCPTIGVFVKVRKPSRPQVIWLAALALSLRCVLIQ